MNTKAMKTLAVLLVLVSAFSTLELIPMPKVMATPTILLDPTSGHVGDTVTVTGTIDIADGTFTVRWDQTLNVTSGEAVGNGVAASFIVPPTNASPSGRDVTVELIDDTAGNVTSIFFTLLTDFVLHVETPSPPKQLQEGNTTSIKINVTGGLPNTIYAANITVKNPANQTHSSIVQLSNTTSTGSGNATSVYPTDFGAHMNLTGTYYVAFNDTIATSEFFVGLTDKSEYQRNEAVLVQAAGYTPSEIVKVDIRTGESSVSGFPKNSTASSGGLVTLSWTVLQNATPGIYIIALTNTTSSGTVKTPSDTQKFNVTGVVCLVQARNLADEAVEGALVEAYNASAPTSVLTSGSTNSTGWIRFNLDRGNYTFKAFIRNAEVAAENQTITADTEFLLTLKLVNFVATVKTEDGERIPLIDIALDYNYTTRDNNIAAATASARTNTTGSAALRNLFTNVTYTVEAKRYGMLFNTTTVIAESSPISSWISLDLTLPTYTMNVHAVDAKDSDAAGVDIRVYEWASGVTTPLRSMETSFSGDVFFSLPFGRYLLHAFKGGDFLTETVVDLDEPLAFTFNLRALNVDVTVFVFDYFGQPIANAEVKIERKIGQEFVLVSSQFTGSSGSAQFASIIGGESRLSVYLAGKLAGVQTQFLGSGSSEVTFRIGEYIALLGYPIASGAFAFVIFVIIIFVIIALVLARKRVSKVFRKKPKR